MNKLFFVRMLAVMLAAQALNSNAATITVTTADNNNVQAGETSLLQALNSAQDGDVIEFNIPGTGIQYIVTPAGGYPYITANDLTIDGYSQPGAAPNTNPILAANNAQIKIVLDSRNGNSTLMNYPGVTANDDTGYGDTESAVLGILRATNVTVRGVAIISKATTDATGNIALYGISFAQGANGKIKGCWIGVDPQSKQTDFGMAPIYGITGFRYRGRDENNSVTNTVLIENVSVGVDKNSVEPRADFNVITGCPGIPIILEGQNNRISGNFLEVLPDGNHDYDAAYDQGAINAGIGYEGSIEIGRSGNNSVIGVDGDGVNDSEERNVFGGLVPESLGGYPHIIEFYGNDPGTNIVVAGNYFGVGVDGSSRFTNGVPALNASGGSAKYQFGSNVDGVSDDVEGNVVYNNYPDNVFGITGPNFPFNLSPNFFDELSDTGLVALRGNTLVNNITPPVDPSYGQNYFGQVLVDSTGDLKPVIDSGSAMTVISGAIKVPKPEFPHVELDVYIVDPEGLALGVAVNDPTRPEGFIQGKTYLGTFVVDGPQDMDPAANAYRFDISPWGLAAGTKLTVTANYAAAAGELPLTSLFSAPVAIVSAAQISTVSREGNSLTINWSGGTGPFQLQHRDDFPGTGWTDIGGPITGNSTTVTVGTGREYFRVIGQ